MALATKHRDKAHARIYVEWLNLPAWREMDAVARALIVELIAKYRPTEPNLIILSDRSAARLLGCSRPTAAKAVARLLECGWLSLARMGKMIGPAARRPSAYSLTMQPLYPGDMPTMAFQYWRPPFVNGQRHIHKRPKSRPETAQFEAGVESEHVLSKTG